MAHVEVMVDGVAPNGRGAFADFAEKGKIVNATGKMLIVGAPHGTGFLASRTLALIAVGIPLNDGYMALAQMSLEQLLNAADMMKERYGDPRVKIGR